MSLQETAAIIRSSICVGLLVVERAMVSRRPSCVRDVKVGREINKSKVAQKPERRSTAYK
jgi:hypothetical protein